MGKVSFKKSSTVVYEHINLPVVGMMCAVCAGSVERIVRASEGVVDVDVNLSSSSMNLIYDPQKTDLQTIQSRLQAEGYDLIISENKKSAFAEQENIEYCRYVALRRKVYVAWLLTIIIMMLSMSMMKALWVDILLMVSTLLVIIFCGRQFYSNGFRRAMALSPNMDTLVMLSTSVSFLYSFYCSLFNMLDATVNQPMHIYYDASAMILTFVLTGKLIEMRARYKTGSAIRSLMKLQPDTATLLLSDDSSKEVDVSELKVGDLILVRPGERVAIDGVVVKGCSSVDESILSGESLPVDKFEEDKVSAGTLNCQGALTVRVEKVGEETILSKIIESVRIAQGSKAPVQKIVDKISRVFVPTIMVISIITFIIWLCIGGVENLQFAILTSVSVLVIACPCALGLATPTALTVGIGKAALNKILIKDATALEQLSEVDVVVFDKTGTLTKGTPAVVREEWFEERNENLVEILVSIEQRSEHHLSRAICEYPGFSVKQFKDIDQFCNYPGMGVSGRCEQADYWVGSLRMARKMNVKNIDEIIKIQQESLGSIVYFGCFDNVLAVIEIADEIKTDAADVVAELRRLGCEVFLLTGDNAPVSMNMGKIVGIDHVLAETLPADKERFVRELQQKKMKVAMIGDGINDSPALAAADVSIAMSNGSDIAMDVAQVTLVEGDLKQLPIAIKLSKETVKLIKQNLFWAFIYNVVGIPIAAGLLYPFCGVALNPMIASGAMAFSSVSVVVNSLRLKYKKA